MGSLRFRALGACRANHLELIFALSHQYNVLEIAKIIVQGTRRNSCDMSRLSGKSMIFELSNSDILIATTGW